MSEEKNMFQLAGELRHFEKILQECPYHLHDSPTYLAILERVKELKIKLAPEGLAGKKVKGIRNPYTVMYKGENDWFGPGYVTMKCPGCDGDYVHLLGGEYTDGEDDYKAWQGRGDVRGVLFVCESCNTVYAIRFGFHKGQTAGWMEVLGRLATEEVDPDKNKQEEGQQESVA